ISTSGCLAKSSRLSIPIRPVPMTATNTLSLAPSTRLDRLSPYTAMPAPTVLPARRRKSRRLTPSVIVLLLHSFWGFNAAVCGSESSTATVRPEPAPAATLPPPEVSLAAIVAQGCFCSVAFVPCTCQPRGCQIWYPPPQVDRDGPGGFIYYLFPAVYWRPASFLTVGLVASQFSDLYLELVKRPDLVLRGLRWREFSVERGHGFPVGNRDILAMLLLGACVVALFWRVCFTRAMFFGRDIFNYTYPNARHIHEVCLKGQLPYWNPITDRSSWLIPTFSSFILSRWPSSSCWSTSLTRCITGSTLSWGAIGVYLRGRRLSQSRLAAWAAALLFVFSGPVISLGSFYNH